MEGDVGSVQNQSHISAHDITNQSHHSSFRRNQNSGEKSQGQLDELPEEKPIVGN